MKRPDTKIIHNLYAPSKAVWNFSNSHRRQPFIQADPRAPQFSQSSWPDHRPVPGSPLCDDLGSSQRCQLPPSVTAQSPARFRRPLRTPATRERTMPVTHSPRGRPAATGRVRDVEKTSETRETSGVWRPLSGDGLRFVNGCRGALERRWDGGGMMVGEFLRRKSKI